MAKDTSQAQTGVLALDGGRIQTMAGNAGAAGAQLFAGNAGSRLLAASMDAGVLRPWQGKDGHYYANIRGSVRRVDNATLRRDEWIDIDNAVLKAAQTRLIGVADLVNAGLTYEVSNGLGKTVLEYQDQSDISAAEVTMDAETRTTRDRPEWDTNYLPLPVTHKDFQFSIRALEASRTRGEPLDMTMAELAGRKVAEKVESILFTGLSAYTHGGGTIRGYLDQPNRNTVSLTANWDDTVSNVLTDVLGMKQASIDARYYGPWQIYIPTNFETAIDDDFKTNSDRSVRERILAVSGISGVKVADSLTADNVLMIQMTSDVVRMVIGLSIMTVEWDSNGGLTKNFKVMAIMVPQIRNDQDGRCGVVHAS